MQTRKKLIRKSTTDLGTGTNYSGHLSASLYAMIQNKECSELQIQEELDKRQLLVEKNRERKLELIRDYDLQFDQVTKADGLYCLYFKRETERRIFTFGFKLTKKELLDFELRAGYKIEGIEHDTEVRAKESSDEK